MQKILAVAMVFMLCVGAFIGCNSDEYQDGVYRAEFEGFDERGYKDYIEITVENGTVTDIQYDAVNAEGTLKSEDEQYIADMHAAQNNFTNYPDRVHKDLITQYLMGQDVSKVDAIAGSTYTSDCFLTLYRALEKQIYKGDTSLLLVENIPTK